LHVIDGGWCMAGAARWCCQARLPPSPTIDPLCNKGKPMKLCRYGAPGQELPGLIDAAGRLRALAGHPISRPTRSVPKRSPAWLRSIPKACPGGRQSALWPAGGRNAQVHRHRAQLRRSRRRIQRPIPKSRWCSTSGSVACKARTTPW
jgi:hypothetical protein